MKNVVILGGGITGLSAALRLSEIPGFQVHVIEKESEVGGVCRSFKQDDFILDYGPHKFYTLIDGINEELKKVMGSELQEKEKKQSLYLKGKYFDFPLKLKEMLFQFPLKDSVASVGSFGVQAAKNIFEGEDTATYEDFLISKFGKKLYQTVFEPMAHKMFGDPQELDRKLAEVRISSPGLIAVLKQVLFQRKVDRTVSAPNFLYPKQGFGRIAQRFYEVAKQNGVKFHLNSEAKNIKTENGKFTAVTYQEGNSNQVTIPCDYLIYTLPLSYLDNLVEQGLPTDIRAATRFVRFRHTIIYYYLLKSKPILPSMWVFFPESQFRFGRLSEMLKFSEETCPKGTTSLMVDFTCDNDSPEWTLDDVQLGQQLYEQLRPLKLFESPQIISQFSKRFRNFYPIYAVGYQEHLEAVRRCEKLFNNLFFIGRLGDFNYNNSDQCMDMGFQAAQFIKDQQGELATHDWESVRHERFEQYKIVD